MQVIGIKELQTNPAKLTKAFQERDYLLITKHGQPLGLAIPFDKGMMDQGLMPWFAIKGFQNGDLSLGQLAKILNRTHHDTIKLLGSLSVPIADYNLEEDLAAIEQMLNS